MYLWLIIASAGEQRKNPKKITQILRKVIGSVIKKGFPEEEDVAHSTRFRNFFLFSYERDKYRKMTSHIVPRKS